MEYVDLGESSVQEVHLRLDDIIADKEIRNFKPRSRKCKFNEDYDKNGYYDVRICHFFK